MASTTTTPETAWLPASEPFGTPSTTFALPPTLNTYGAPFGDGGGSSPPRSSTTATGAAPPRPPPPPATTATRPATMAQRGRRDAPGRAAGGSAEPGGGAGVRPSA